MKKKLHLSQGELKSRLETSFGVEIKENDEIIKVFLVNTYYAVWVIYQNVNL